MVPFYKIEEISRRKKLLEHRKKKDRFIEILSWLVILFSMNIFIWGFPLWLIPLLIGSGCLFIVFYDLKELYYL